MKKLILAPMFMCFALVIFGQSQRTVLIEEFTQASCPPCETTTPALNAILHTNDAKVVQIRYQTSWPGVDPMNADNPGEVQTRVTYYDVGGVPDVRADGTYTGVGVITQAQIDTRHAVTSPVSMTLTHELSADLKQITATLMVTNEDSVAYSPTNHKLRVAVVEEEINWPYTPGSTSLVDFEYVMKTFLTGAAGENVGTIEGGQTMEFTWTQDLPETIYNYNKLAVVAFIQNDTDKQVVQATDSQAEELTGYPDLSITNTGSTSDDICDLAYAPSVTVSNESDVDVSDFTVTLYNNGTEIASENITETLSANSTTDVSMSEITLPPGSSNISYNVVTNDGTDIILLNSETAASLITKAGDALDVLDKDFESASIGFQPDDMILDIPFPIFVVDADILDAANPIGGFGESDVSLRINYWNWNPANFSSTGFMAIADQLLVNEDNAAINFDYAYTPWQNSADKMEVQVSTNCGETFTTLWEKSGVDMQTGPQVNLNNAFFLPATADWSKETVDISEYLGETLLVRFFFTSAWGDMLYLDNINANGVTAVNLVEIDETLSIFPNPASELTNINMELSEAAQVRITLLDQLGRKVSAENFGTLNGKISLQYNVANLPTGIYQMQIQLDDKAVYRKITVE